MSNSLTRFSNRVENYVKYRPGYPVEMVEFLIQKLQLNPSHIIADIGSGTGISSEVFLKNGNIVFGIEPNSEMRKAAENLLSSYSNFKSIDGTSDHTTLNNYSVDHIISAQAFHWFNPKSTRVEFKRILKPNGNVVLIWNDRETDTSSFLKAYEDLLQEFSTDYKEVNHKNISEARIKDFYKNDFITESFPNYQIFDYEGLRGRLLSSSYVPSGTEPKYSEMLERLKEIFISFQDNDRVVIEYKTIVFVGELI